MLTDEVGAVSRSQTMPNLVDHVKPSGPCQGLGLYPKISEAGYGGTHL